MYLYRAFIFEVIGFRFVISEQYFESKATPRGKMFKPPPPTTRILIPISFFNIKNEL